MKRIVPLVTALMLSVPASARFGITGGLTTTQTKNIFSELKTATSFHAGITFDVPLVLGFEIQPSLIYNQSGKSLVSVTSGSDYKTGYLELPLQLQWGINLGKVIRPYIFAEPFVGYLIHANVKNAAGNWEKVSDLSAFNRWAYGIGLGAGIKLFEHLQVSARYYWNLEKPFANLKENITKEKCKGVRVTAAILF